MIELYGNDAGFDVCFDFHMRLLHFEDDDRAITTSAAPSASMSAMIASHQVRRERMAELIIAAKIFSGQYRDQ
jgi:predicted permease